DPTEPLRVDQGKDTPLSDAKVTWTREMDRIQEFRHLLHASGKRVQSPWDALALRLLGHHRGGERQEPDHRAHLEPGGAAVGELQEVVVEAVLLVPHAILPGPVHGRGDIQKMLDELED